MADLENGKRKSGIKWIDEMPELTLNQKLIQDKLKTKARQLTDKFGFKVEPYEVRQYEVAYIVKQNEPYKSEKQKALAEIKAQLLVQADYPQYDSEDNIVKQPLHVSHYLYEGLDNDVDKRAYLKQKIAEIKKGINIPCN